MLICLLMTINILSLPIGAGIYLSGETKCYLFKKNNKKMCDFEIKTLINFSKIIYTCISAFVISLIGIIAYVLL
jgi:uncharacterized Tic20 family protein